MSNLIPFTYNDQPVRVVEVGSAPWFVASDVAAILGYRMASDMTRRLDDDERGTRSVRTPSGDQEMTVISEAGLYVAVLGSKLPAAKEFKRWVTHEVLPAIRKHGGYLTPEMAERVLTDPDTIIRLATDLKAEREARQALEAQAVADRPKVLFADAVSTADSTVLIGELAKILRGNGIELGATRLFRWMRANGFLIAREGSDFNSPTQKAMELGLFKIKETTIVHSDGHTSISKTPKVTGKGQEYFVSRFLDGRFTPEVAA